MGRSLKACIDLNALHSNLIKIKQHAPHQSVIAMVKANGYGHGLQLAARGLEAADAFGVACIEEALLLRQFGNHKRIVLMEGFFTPSELTEITAMQFEPVIHHDHQVEALLHHQQPLTVWLKVDTGMHRLGFSVSRFLEVFQLLQNHSTVTIAGVMTHFASADDLQSHTTKNQLEIFKQVLKQLPSSVMTSLSNSAAILGWPAAHGHWVRPGIILYGASPFSNQTGESLGFQPAMTLQTELIAKIKAKKGETIGYTGRYCCPEDMWVGVIAVGYADGYPVSTPDGTPVLLNGKRVPVVGRVSMDMTSIDLRTQPEADVGDPVVLWGPGLPVEEIAQKIGVIPYQLLTGLGTRVQRVEQKNVSSESHQGSAREMV